MTIKSLTFQRLKENMVITFMDWLTKVKLVFEHKQYGDPHKSAAYRDKGQETGYVVAECPNNKRKSRKTKKKQCDMI